MKKRKEKKISAEILLPRKKRKIFFQGRKSTLEKIFPGAKPLPLKEQ